MLRQFAQKVEEMRRLIDDSRSASFLLAVSGGMDSMCMLDLFSKTLPASDFAVAHCNFSLRGEESDGDQDLVEARAAELGVRMFVKRFDTVSYAQEHGVSIEMAARELRYTWFGELCREHGFNLLSVAHNANDNAETLMLNLLRGTGLNGLHGMAGISLFDSRTDNDLHWPSPTLWAPPPGRGWQNANSGHMSAPPLLFRPLLDFTRKQIEGYVLTHRVPFRHDSSNFESDYKRNRIRNEVFPIFEKINPSFVRTLNREIGYFTEAGSIVDDWCLSQLPNVLVPSPVEGRTGDGHFRSEARTPVSCPTAVRPSSDCNLTTGPYSEDGDIVGRHYEEEHSHDVVISTAKLLETPHWRYLLYYILQPYGFNSQTIASVEDLLASDRTISGKRFESPTHTLLTTRDSLMVVPLSSLSASYRECNLSSDSRSGLSERSGLSDDIMVIRGCGTYNFNGSRLSVEVLERTPEMSLKQPSGTLILDADTLQFPFVCRRWRQGDWLIPLGMRGKKKVSDLFADLKFNNFQKDAAVILVDTRSEGLAEQQHIAGLLGHRIDDRYKVTPSTRTILRLTLL